ncbi:MAG: ABC transporter permease [Gemmatimonadetes bacterium]|nr:ABC transporter permease [Gemmatimonadota bacterium]
MSEIWIVIQREFLERVRTKSFVLGTILLPLFVAGVVILPAMLRPSGGERTLVVVDEAPAGVADRMIEVLSAPRASADETTFTVERVAGPVEGVREQLNARVLAEEIDGYVWLPADVVERGSVVYRARDVGSIGVNREVQRAATDAVRAVRLRESGIAPAQIAALVQPVELETARITRRGEEGAGEMATLGFSYIVGFLIYMMIILYGQNVMRSVLEEKTNRIVEVIISSMKASHLVAGKLLGVCAVAVLQVAIWMLFMVGVVTQSNLLERRLGVPVDALRAVSIEPLVGLALIGFFLLGFLLFGALFAAVGAAVSSEQEAQQMVAVVLVPLFVPLLFMLPVLTDPMGTTATTLGMIPFTAPMVMPMRMGATAIPTAQILGSLALLALTVLLVTWMVGKVYRVGILSTGKRPSLRELGRWLRTA